MLSKHHRLFPLPPAQAVEDVQGAAALKVRHLGLQRQHPGPQPLALLRGLPGLPSLNIRCQYHGSHVTSSPGPGSAPLRSGQKVRRSEQRSDVVTMR